MGKLEHEKSPISEVKPSHANGNHLGLLVMMLSSLHVPIIRRLLGRGLTSCVSFFVLCQTSGHGMGFGSLEFRGVGGLRLKVQGSRASAKERRLWGAPYYTCQKDHMEIRILASEPLTIEPKS